MADDTVVKLRNLSVRVDALRRAMDATIGGTTPDLGKWVAFKSYARSYNFLVREYMKLCDGSGHHTYDIDKMKGSTGTVWPVQKEIFDMIYSEVLMLSAVLAEYDTGSSASISAVQDLLVANLRKAVFSKPDREIDIQNSVESLLVGRGYQKSIDYDREGGKLKFSGKEFIPDFVFPNISLAVEIKLIKERSGISKCVEEMSADVPAYLSVYKNVLFCVYDLGEIRDVTELQGGLQNHDGVRVCVIKH